MRRARLLLCLGAGLQGVGARDEAAERLAFVELSSPQGAYFVGEPFRLELRFGVDASLLDSGLLQLFPRELDVPVQVEADWLRGLRGARPFAGTERAEPHSGQRPTFALDDAPTAAERLQDRLVSGRPFAVLALERSFVAERPGPLVIPAPLLRFAYATRFEPDVLGGRVALDRRDAAVHGEPLALDIRALPEAGRPLAFRGGVGRFRVHADAEPRALEVGESLKLTMRVEGEGSLAEFEPPTLDALEGFRVYGSLAGPIEGEDARTLTYDLAPEDETLREIPPIELVFFDPTPPADYRTLRTAPIPLAVRPRRSGARAEPPPVVPASEAAPAGGAPRRLSPLAPAIALAGAGAIVVAVLLFRGRARLPREGG